MGNIVVDGFDYAEEAREDGSVLEWVDALFGGCEYHHHVPLLVEGSDLIDDQQFNFLLRGDRGIDHVCHRFMKGLLRPISIPLVTVPGVGVSIDTQAFKDTLAEILYLETVTDGPDLRGFKYSPTDHEWSGLIGKHLNASMLLPHLLHYRRVVAPKVSLTSVREAMLSHTSDQPGCPQPPSPINSRVVDEATCSLCMEIMLEPVTLKCGHSGCLECIQKARLDTSCCPVCRAEHSDAITVSITLRNLIESLFEHDVSFKLRKDKEFRRKHEESLRAKAALQYYTTRFEEKSRSLDESLDWEDNFRRNFNNADAFENDTKLFYSTGFPQNSSPTSLWMTSEVNTEDEALDEIDVDILDRSLVNILMKAGCSRIENAPVEDSVLTILKKYIKESLSLILSRCVLGVSARRSVVITSRDALNEIQDKGTVFYGYGINGYKGLWTRQINFILCQVHTGLVLASSALAVVNDLCTAFILRILKLLKSCGTMERAFRHYDAAASSRCSFLVPYLRLTSGGDSVIFVRDTEELPHSPLMPLDHSLIQGSSVVLQKHIQFANRKILTGALYEHAVHEGTKAIETLRASSHTQNIGISLEVLSHLVFSPEKIALLCAKEENVVLSDGAAVYLTATVEYLVAELMELAGNSAKDSDSDFIEARHIAFAIYNDKEVSEVFLTGNNFFGGHQGIVRGGSSAKTFRSTNHRIANAAFDKILHGKAGMMPHRVIVDPRDGQHYRALSEDGPLIHMYELDAASDSPVSSRKQAAIAALSHAECSVLQRCIREKVCNGSMVAPSRPLEGELQIPVMVFYPLCRQLIFEHADERIVDIKFTTEAIDVLQEYLEWEIFSITQRALSISNIIPEKLNMLTADILRVTLEMKSSC